MRIFAKFLGLVASLFFVNKGFNQKYAVRHLTIKEGLASSQVIGFTQDDKGYIWMATAGGLQRFDGQNFITYRHNNNDTFSLAYDEGFNPTCDKEHDIWLKTPNSYVNILDPRNGRVKKMTIDPRLKSTLGEEFISYAKDSKDIMWLCSRKALFRYNYKTKNAEIICLIPGFDSSFFYHPMIYDSISGSIWIGIHGGLIKYDIQKKLLYDYKKNPDNCPALNLKTEPYSLFIDRQRNLWIASWRHECFRYNFDTHVLKQFNIPIILKDGRAGNTRDIVKGIVQGQDDNIWIGTENGSIFLYDKVKDTFTVAINQLNELLYSNNIGIVSMFRDREGNIWIATAFGAYLFNPEKQKIYSVTNNPFDKNSFPPKQIESFYETSNNLIWVASRGGGGVSVFDEHFKLLRRLFYERYSKGKTNPGKFVFSFCEDNYHNLWMATLYGELICINLFSDKNFITKVPPLNHVPYAMIRDSNNNLWISCNTTIIRFNPSTKNYSTFVTGNGHEIRDMLIDNQGNFWVGTLQGGLFLFDPKDGKITETFVCNARDGSLSDSTIISLCEYNDSSLLVGTASGVDVFNKRTKKFTSIRVNQGSLSNVTKGINCDKQGNIFITTYNGLYIINKKTNSYTRYSYDDVIQNEVFYSKIYKLRDGRLLSGGLNSFIYFDPQALKETFIPPDVQITGFKVFEDQYPPDSLLGPKGQIHLSYNHNFFTIQYASLFYNAPEQIHYYYKLDGVDKDWVNAGRKRNAVYTALQDGNYTFEVKCANDEGVASGHITKLNILIACPYYKSWWFIFLCAALSAAIIYAVYQSRMQNRKQLSLMRRRIASDLHDDIGSTLNSISVYSQVAVNQLESNAEQTKTLLEKMGSSSRKMIDAMNDIVWAINPKNEDFENMLQRMQYFAGELLSGKNILPQFGIDENIKKIKLPMEKRKNFYLIYKEAINNAHKYSESKNVDVRIALKNGFLNMAITDNGKGFNTVTNGLGGNGLKIMKSRAEEIGAKIEIKSWPGKGTRIVLTMKA